MVKQANSMFEEYEKTGSVNNITFQKYEKSIDSITANFNKFVGIEKQEVEHSQQAALDTIDRFEKIIYGIAITTFILVIALGYFVSKTISRPLLKLQQAFAAVGQGEFSTKIEVSSDDEIGSLTEFFNKMANDLRNTTVSRDTLESANQALLAKIAEKEEAEKGIHRERQNLYNMLDSLPMAFHLQAPDYTVP